MKWNLLPGYPKKSNYMTAHLQVSDSISLCPVLPYKDAHALLHVRHNESFPSLLFQYDLIQGNVIKVLGLLEDMLKSRQ